MYAGGLERFRSVFLQVTSGPDRAFLKLVSRLSVRDVSHAHATCDEYMMFDSRRGRNANF